MKANPVPDDWCLMGQEDMAEMGMEYMDEDIRKTDQLVHKSSIK